MAKTALKKRKTPEKISNTEESFIHPYECPFREFKDSELSFEYWGKGPRELRDMEIDSSRNVDMESFWHDPQHQPLHKTARLNLCTWVRAKEYAEDQWNADVILAEPPKPAGSNEDGKMKMREVMMCHRRLLSKSSFVRQVLSYCYLIERSSISAVMHQSENFTFNPVPGENWRAKHHIYSPNIKPGGGAQHFPTLSPNGCYLVRLFYLGVWRCVWVDDLVPVDGENDPLLPFGPLTTHRSTNKVSLLRTSHASQFSSMNQQKTLVIQLWPLLICKALLKIFAPDQDDKDGARPSFQKEYEEDEDMDESLEGFDIMHHFTGCIKTRMSTENMGFGKLWERLLGPLDLFEWPENESTHPSLERQKSQKSTLSLKKLKFGADTKKSTVIVIIDVGDTEEIPAYELAGLTPAHAFPILVTKARDLPLKKPPPLPVIAPWKKYRWLEWAKLHGLYDAYSCPRTRFLEVCGLMRLSHATHLLDVMSTESICANFKIDIAELANYKKKLDDQKQIIKQLFPEDGIWVLFRKLVSHIESIYFCYPINEIQLRSIGNAINTKNKYIRNNNEVPFYMITDSSTDPINIKFCFSSLSRNILTNDDHFVHDYHLLYPAFVIVETFDWLSKPKKSLSNHIITPVASLRTRGTCAAEITLPAGKYNFRVWVESKTPWHLFLTSEEDILLCNRSYAMSQAAIDSPLALKTMTAIEHAFIAWTKTTESIHTPQLWQEFYRSYRPDRPWDVDDIGYPQSDFHWMMRVALQHYLKTRFHPFSYLTACSFFKALFIDPLFGCYDIVSIGNLEFDLKVDFGTKVLLQQDEELLAKASRATIETLKSMMERSLDRGGCIVVELPEYMPQHSLDSFALKIQTCWRRFKAIKTLNEFKQLEANELSNTLVNMTLGDKSVLSKVKNIMYDLFEGTKHCFSYGNGIAGSCKVHIFSDTITNLSAKRSWIPLCQGIFYCHSATSVQFDLECSTNKQWLLFYNNDTMEEIRVGSRPKMTYMFAPNFQGYTLYAHARIWQKQLEEVEWKLSILTRDETFHCCNNEWPDCIEKPVANNVFAELEDFYIPNEKHLAIKVFIKVVQDSFVNMAIMVSNSKLPITVTISTGNKLVEKRYGFGDYFWSHLKLEHGESKKIPVINPIRLDFSKESVPSKASKSAALKKGKQSPDSAYTTRRPVSPAVISQKPTIYEIEVTATEGWPLTMDEWERIEEIRNYIYSESLNKKTSVSLKKGEKDKKAMKVEISQSKLEILPTDCYCRVEVSSAAEDDVVCILNEDYLKDWKDQVQKWNVPGRILKCYDIRNAFIQEFQVEEEEKGKEEVAVEESEEERSASSSHAFSMSGSSVIVGEPRFILKPTIFRVRCKPLEMIPPYPDLTPKFVEFYPLDEEEMQITRLSLLEQQKKRIHILSNGFASPVWSEKMTEALHQRNVILANYYQVNENVLSNPIPKSKSEKSVQNQSAILKNKSEKSVR